MPGSALHTTLRRTSSLTRLADALATFGFATAGLLAAVLLAVALDALFALNTPARVTINVVLITFTLTAILGVLLRWHGNRHEPRRAARLLEQRLDVHDSRFINAVDLASSGLSGSLALREIAIVRGEELAQTISLAAAIDRGPLKRSALTTSTAILIVLILAALAPRLFGMVVPRFLHPTADLPPFTLLDFTVTTEPARIYFGQPATISVEVTGPFVPESAEAVFIDGERHDRIAMHRREPGVFVLPLDRAERSRRFFIDTQRGRSRTRELTVLPVPRFERVSIRYDYPEYAGWPSVERPLDPSGLRGLMGTRVTFTVQSNLALREADLTIDPNSGSPVKLSPSVDHPEIVTGSFDLRENGTYTLTLTAADGTPGDDPLTGPIVVTADRPPTVQLLAPDLRIHAPEGWKVSITVVASDDIGVDRVVLRHSVNKIAGGEAALELTRHRPTYAAAQTTLDLGQIGAKAGDVVKGFATAFDNRPDPSQAADSATFEVRVLTEEEYRELARQEYALQDLLAELERFAAEREKLDAMREDLIEKLESLREGASQADEAGERLEEYAKESRALADQLMERAEQMALYEFEPKVQEQLKKTAEQLTRQSERARRSGAALSNPSPENIDEAIRQLKEDQEASGQGNEERRLTEKQLRQIELADRLMAESDTVMSIADRQRALADRLTPQPSPTADDLARLRHMAEEQDQLRQELTEALDRIEQAAKEAAQDLPKMSETAGELVGNIRETLQVPADQARASAEARTLRGEPAFTAADSAAGKLESLIKQCKGMGDCASEDLDGALGLTRSQIASALSQLAGARQGPGSGRGFAGGTVAGSQSGVGSAAASTQAGGSPSRYTLMGPHARQPSGLPTARVNLRTGSYNTMGGGFEPDTGRHAERLDPDSPTADRQAIGGPPGVPLPYRRLAEQYFRRLAEDTK